MEPIEFNYKKLRMAQDLGKKTLESVGLNLMQKNNSGSFVMPEASKIIDYLNNLAEKREINHYRLKGEYEEIYLFDSDKIIKDLEIYYVEAKKSPDVIKVQCYDEKVNGNDNIPIEISKIQSLFKLPKSLFNSGSCIYFLCRNEKVVYVGQAENVHQRLTEHMRNKTFDSVFYLRVPANKMDKVEMSLIAYLKPEYNKTGLKMGNKHVSLAESILNVENN